MRGSLSRINEASFAKILDIECTSDESKPGSEYVSSFPRSSLLFGEQNAPDLEY